MDKHPEYRRGSDVEGEASCLYLKSGADPAILATAAETYFLLAEAALRGWEVSGTAKSYYEQGIAVSFEQWGAAVGDYLTSTKKPADFVDILDSQYNSKAVSTVTPKWE